jgi:hypothetical protein
MLKISQIGAVGHSVTLKLEGRIVGPWVREAHDACEIFLAEGSRVKLNLAEVSFVDPDGVKTLKDLVERGVKLVGCSLFVEEQLKPAMND